MKLLKFIFIALVLLACTNTEKEEKKPYVREVEQVLERYPDGKKKLEGELVNGERHGVWKFYYDNGFLWSEGKYWYGKRKGYSIIYYKDGKKKIDGHYKNDLKVGTWRLWNSDGTLNKTIDMNELLTKEDSLKLELK